MIATSTCIVFIEYLAAHVKKAAALPPCGQGRRTAALGVLRPISA
jgi:hypothetical protein